MPGWLSAALVVGVGAALLLCELRWPLRPRRREPKPRRDLRNLALGAAAAAGASLTSGPVSRRLTRLAERRRLGLAQRLPRWLELPAALALLDYSLYAWHVLLHEVPLLWRFHAVHHADLDMDATTAARFHLGELALSTALQAAQILLIGVTPRTYSIWTTWLGCEVLFHHANVALPPWLERHLCRVLVTPRMHGVHHSLVPDELGSNWSSGLTLWDWLHGTLRLDVLGADVTVGLAAYPDAAALTLPRLLAMPFGPQRLPPWRAPDGRVARRGG